jgi:serine/threonine protein kinase
LHRDVKAQNVVRQADGRIVLMDFGAGRETDSEPAASWPARRYMSLLNCSPAPLRPPQATSTASASCFSSC